MSVVRHIRSGHNSCQNCCSAQPDVGSEPAATSLHRRAGGELGNQSRGDEDVPIYIGVDGEIGSN
jgi:hypothetical protein